MSGRLKLRGHLASGPVSSPRRVIEHELFRRGLLFLGPLHGIIPSSALSRVGAHEGVDAVQEARLLVRRRTPGGRGARSGRTRLGITLLQVLLRLVVDQVFGVLQHPGARTLPD